MQAGTIKWLGHATFRVESLGGQSILIDPWLRGNPSCPASEESQSDLDIILLTHGHDDHVADLLETAAANPSATVITVLEAANLLVEHGLSADRTLGMNLGGEIAIDGVKVSMVEARHTSSLRLADRAEYAGVPVGYVVALEDERAIYFAGDTSLFGDMTLIGELYQPSIAVLPIGGHFTMGGSHAARAARMVGAQFIIPCHYQTFPMLAQDCSALKAGLGEAPHPTVIAPKSGVEFPIPG